MRTIYFSEFMGELQVKEVPPPIAAPNGVVIEVKATGLCRSDWHAWMGHDSDVALPHVPGHELSGVVSSAGAGVEKFRVGDRVTVPFVNGCGSCSYCQSGNAQVCPTQTQPGFTQWGSYAEFVTIENADFNLVLLPESISFAAAASIPRARAFTARLRSAPPPRLAASRPPSVIVSRSIRRSKPGSSGCRRRDRDDTPGSPHIAGGCRWVWTRARRTSRS